MEFKRALSCHSRFFDFDALTRVATRPLGNLVTVFPRFARLSLRKKKRGNDGCLCLAKREEEEERGIFFIVSGIINLLSYNRFAME